MEEKKFLITFGVTNHLSPPKILEPQVELMAPKKAAALDRAVLVALAAAVSILFLDFLWKANFHKTLILNPKNLPLNAQGT